MNITSIKMAERWLGASCVCSQSFSFTVLQCQSTIDVKCQDSHRAEPARAHRVYMGRIQRLRRHLKESTRVHTGEAQHQ